MSDHNETADHQHQGYDHERHHCFSRPLFAVEHRGLGEPEERRIDRERREEQRNLGEDGAYHPA